MWNASTEPNAYAVDLVAWDFTRGKHGCASEFPYPTEHTRWGLAGTANTMTFVHIDSDGFNTFLKIVCGMKVWGVYKEKLPATLSSTNAFLHPSFHLNAVDETTRFDLEAVVLKPGNLL